MNKFIIIELRSLSIQAVQCNGRIDLPIVPQLKILKEIVKNSEV